ncbi:MAG: efflux RND transporter periplasmic adaptor subunit [Cyanobacteria bacterium SZAS TMP-1]|nr:efflux RND transporter periplasmic adaptor subunit [Cyanobacteria bacterium SZAS TMP-1]
MDLEVPMQTTGIKSESSEHGGKLPAFLSSSVGRPPDRRKIVIAAVVSVIVLATAGGVALKTFVLDKAKPASPSNHTVLTVELTPVKSASFERKLLVSGTVAAWDPVQVGSEVNGLKVESIAVDDGAHVKKGQVMATLNGSILKAQLAQQEARLSAAQASLSKAIQPNRPEDLTALRAAYAQAQASVAQEDSNLIRARASYAEAEANARRYEGLVREGAVSAQEGLNRATLAKTTAADVRTAEQKVRAAKFSAQQAHERLAMGLSGGRTEDVTMSRASLAEIQATVNQLRSQVAQTIIKAPCDGLVMKRSVHIGDIASTSKVMFDLVRDGRLELRAQVPEADLSRILPGEKVEVQAVHIESKPIVGVVREISPSIDLDSRLGTVRIDLPSSQESDALRCGNFARGEILLGHEPVLVVPSDAVVYKDNRAIVFTVSADQTAQMRFIETGERNLDSIEVKSGLKRGESIVAKGAGFLKDGDSVKVVTRQ